MTGAGPARTAPDDPDAERADAERADSERADAERPGVGAPVGDEAPVLPVLPYRAPDDSDLGWGERRGGEERDDDWYERERPPHW